MLAPIQARWTSHKPESGPWVTAQQVLAHGYVGTRFHAQTGVLLVCKVDFARGIADRCSPPLASGWLFDKSVFVTAGFSSPHDADQPCHLPS